MRQGQERKTTKKAIKNPTTQDIYWAAGFCEGEATFYHKKGSGEVHINQKNSLEPLQKMLSLFGGNIYKIHSRAKGGYYFDIWGIVGSRARGFMMTIFPLMSPKRKNQIKKVLGYSNGFCI